MTKLCSINGQEGDRGIVRHFVRMMERDGFSRQFALDESEILLSRADRNEYIRVQRTGMLPITRRQRMSIWLTWECAHNHYAIECEVKKNLKGSIDSRLG